MSTSKPEIFMANLQENTSCITSMHMDREKKGSKSGATTAKSVTSKVPIGPIAFLIDKMNSNKSLPKNTMKLLSYNCEVAARRAVFKCTGWQKFVLHLGLKPMPEEEK